MYAEGKLPEPDDVDGIGPLWKPARIEQWAEREWWDTQRWRKRPEKVRSRRNPKAPASEVRSEAAGASPTLDAEKPRLRWQRGDHERISAVVHDHGHDDRCGGATSRTIRARVPSMIIS